MNPGISIKPFYNSGEMDMNIIPLVYQTNLYRSIDMRLISVLNYGFRRNGNGIINYGAEIALPYFFKRSNKYVVSQGFYLAPVISALKFNDFSNEYNTGILLEPGIAFSVEEKASISIGLQLGVGYYSFREEDNKWDNQIGLKIILGNWF